MSTARASPRAIVAASSLTSSWGELPPTVVVIVVRGSTPSRRPRSAPGSGYFHETMSTTATVSSAASTERVAPASTSAARAASPRRSMGSRVCARSSGRSDTWPAPITTGVRGSITKGKLPVAGEALGQVVLDRRPERLRRRRAVRADGPVAARSTQVGVGDAGEVLLAPDGLGHAAQLVLDGIELVAVRFEGLRVVRDLGGEALVGDAEPQPASCRGGLEEPGLEARPGIVADAIALHPARLVIARVEQAVVHPHGVDPPGRHEHRRGPAVEPRPLELMPLVVDFGRAATDVPLDVPADRARRREAVRDQHVLHVRGVAARAPAMEVPQH